jgi:hypothetical protein
MPDRFADRLPPLPGLIAGALVVLGVVLWMFVSKSLLVVAGLGVVGPGILRELGWLKDHDEFQRQAAHRAGYHAYLVGGLVAVLVYSAEHWRPSTGGSSDLLLNIMVVMWLAWMFSALLRYWGARKTASSVLIVFGSFWALFVIASLMGESGAPKADISVWEVVLGVLTGASVISAFFVPAWTAFRWPRPTGRILLLITLLFFVVFTTPALGRPGGPAVWTRLFTSVLLLGPLLVSAVALLQERTDADEDGREDVAPEAARA